MRTLRNRLAGKCRSIAGAVPLLCALACTTATAQFQANYGGILIEAGRTGVQQTPAGVWLATGESNSPNSTDMDVYFVAANNCPPTVLVEKTYDLGGDDYGKDIHQLADGNYVITGYTHDRVQNQDDAFILKIDPAGNVIWAWKYGFPDEDEQAYDIDELPGSSYKPLVICGRSTAGHGGLDGLIACIFPNGPRIWIAYYGGSNDDYFFSLAQAPNSSTYGAEIVATGATHSFPGPDANVFTAQVASFAGNLIWANSYGIAGSDEGTRCIRQCDPAGPNTGNFVLAGNSGNGVPFSSEAMLMRVTSATGALVGGVTTHGWGGWDEMMGVVEVPATSPREAGFFIGTGLVFNAPGAPGNYDLYLTKVDPNLVFFPPARVQGNSDVNQGWSINVAPPITNSGDAYSVIACGLTNAVGWSGAQSQQLYLTNTRQNLTTQTFCQDFIVTPQLATPPFVRTTADFQPLFYAPDREITARVRVYDRPEICNDPLCGTIGIRPDLPAGPRDAHDMNQTTPWVSDSVNIIMSDNLTSTVTGDADAGSKLTAYPNPIRKGIGFTLDYLLESDATVSIVVTDVTGRTVYSETMELTSGATRIPIDTEGWSAGTYLVRMTAGDTRETRSIVVTD